MAYCRSRGLDLAMDKATAADHWGPRARPCRAHRAFWQAVLRPALCRSDLRSLRWLALFQPGPHRPQWVREVLEVAARAPAPGLAVPRDAHRTQATRAGGQGRAARDLRQ